MIRTCPHVCPHVSEAETAISHAPVQLYTCQFTDVTADIKAHVDIHDFTAAKDARGYTVHERNDSIG